MIAPRWFKLRWGPYVRRELDRRAYHRLFHHRDQIHGAHRAWLLAKGKHISEAESPATTRPRPTIVEFSGLDGYFEPLRGHGGLVHAELRRMTRPAFLPPLSEAPFIGIHIRAGDFPEAWRQPVEWYASMLQKLRSHLGTVVPARVYSDGREEEILPMLRLPDVHRVEARSAVTDMLDLAQASCVVASSSTFSLWASYLGDIPSVWFPARLTVRALFDDEREVECDQDGRVPSPFLEAVNALIQRRARS